MLMLDYLSMCGLRYRKYFLRGSHFKIKTCTLWGRPLPNMFPVTGDKIYLKWEYKSPVADNKFILFLRVATSCCNCSIRPSKCVIASMPSTFMFKS